MFDSRKSSASENCNGCNNKKPVINGQRRPSDIPVFSRRTSENVGLGRRTSNSSEAARKPSSEMDASELQQRRLSEAGLRRSSTSDVVLNENTSNLMVGMRVWVDGTKPGTFAYNEE
jgi:hypothetical protein